MIKRFEEYIAHLELFNKENKIILAVSGGLDSMVMADLFVKSGYKIAIAHCNFRLRAREAGGDEEFVESFAQKAGIPFFKRRFNTRAWAAKNGISIQMAARDLRYRWFNKLMRLYHYDFVATAHHADDDIETFFINLIRGTGINGLSGIAPRMRNFVRPLLFASREEILQYARDNNIEWREDSSNRETKYVRNQIRHKVIPLFTETSPGFKTMMYANMQRIAQAAVLYKKEIENQRLRCVMQFSSSTLISIPKLLQLQPPETYLFEFLQPYGFSWEKTMDVFRSLNSQPGKQFYSLTHKLVKDRDYLMIERRTTSVAKVKEWFINDTVGEIRKPLNMQFEVLDHHGKFRKSATENLAHLDLDKLSFPLILRHWKTGDFFYPLGMENRKKLSDFFTDLKLDLHQKQKVWLLCSGKEVVWVCGYRIDNRYKITASTRKILKITIKEENNGANKNA